MTMRYALAVLLSLSCAAGGWAQTLQTIGVASAVRGLVKATAPGAAVGRVLETGKTVYLNDHVTTDATGKLQVLLNDETSFTLGPNSDMVLDEFVYDPKTSVGKVSASIFKGLFRFVTGKVARRDPGHMRIRTPAATIGIRGTMVAGEVAQSESTIVLIGPGRDNNAGEAPGGISVGNDKGTVDIDRTGYATTIKQGGAPSAPFELPGGRLDAILKGIASAPKGEGRGGVGGKAGETSEDDKARGGRNYREALGVLNAQKPWLSQYAEQVGGAVFPDGPTSWDVVRGITSGTGQYVGSNHYTANVNDVMSVTLNIDFGAKTLGGGASTITTAGAVPASTNINQFSYATATGPSSVDLHPNLSNTFNFLTATLQLQNAGGVPAKAAVVTATFWTGAATVYTGTVNATR